VARYPRRIRTRLTLAFVIVLALVLAVTGVLIYGQFGNGLVSTLDQGLVQREQDVRELADGRLTTAQLVTESGERLLQIYAPSGGLLASTRHALADRLLQPAEVTPVRRAGFSVTTQIAGEDDDVRVRAFPLTDRHVVVAIGTSLDRSHHDQHRLLVLLALVLPAALLLASYTGYLVAGAALRPVERMRERAAGITEADLSDRLPVAATDDELERLGHTLNDMLERLDTTVRRERRLVSDASHELRTPLTILRAELDNALRSDGDRDTLRMAIASALEEVRRLSRLSEDLLVLARADQGRLPLRPEPLDVQDLVEDAARRHHHAAAELGRMVTADVRIDGGAVVLADPDRTAQMLDNLVTNALRYGAGPVELSVIEGAGGQVEIAVRDHGTGLPEDFADRAFERFSQADSARSGPHSGLGLSIVAALAEAQGGEASAANDPDGGAVITIALPHA
jgi:two-component system OmpR family sensor kinase